MSMLPGSTSCMIAGCMLTSDARLGTLTSQIRFYDVAAAIQPVSGNNANTPSNSAFPATTTRTILAAIRLLAQARAGLSITKSL